MGEYEMLPSNKLEGFTLRLFQLLPTLYSHRFPAKGRRVPHE